MMRCKSRPTQGSISRSLLLGVTGTTFSRTERPSSEAASSFRPTGLTGGRATRVRTMAMYFLDSTFRLEGQGTSGDGHCDIARAPASSFPDAEFVLINSKLDGITSDGWRFRAA